MGNVLLKCNDKVLDSFFKNLSLSDAIFKPYGLNIGWRFFYFSEISLVFGFVIALGIFGAWLATTQHLLGFRAKK